MDTKQYVDSLFAHYEQSDTLTDFKAELQSNLDARIAGMLKKGISGEEAFAKASKELDGISALADELSLKKRQDVFAEHYLDVRRYIKPVQAAVYALWSGVLLFGVIVAVMTWFNTESMVPVLGVLCAFVPLSLAGFTFLGLRQETVAVEPMRKKRAVLYAVAVLLLFFGLITAPLSWFAVYETVTAEAWWMPNGTWGAHAESWVPALGVLLAFVLPALILFIFLGLTEKTRLKKWVVDRYQKTRDGAPFDFFEDPVEAARFGVISAAFWLFALAIFGLLWYCISIKIAWVVFVAAAGATLLLQGMMAKRRGHENPR